MKKLFSFVAAALVSVAMFAAPATIPTVAQVEEAFTVGDNVVLVAYFDQAVCNALVWTGTYNGWDTSNPADLTKAVELDDFDGWYVFVFPYALNDDGKCAGKPVQLEEDGSFNWDNQADGTKWTHLAGRELDIDGGDNNNLTFTTSGAGVYIYENEAFQQSPCVEKTYHTYAVTLFAPDCVDENNNTFTPAIAGGGMGWDGVKMSEGMDDDGNALWTYTWYDYEGQKFKFREADGTNWSNQIKIQDEEGNWIDNPDQLLGEDTILVIDYSEGVWTKCVAQERTYTITLKAPTDNCNNYVPAIVGEFNNWGADNEETDEVEAPVIMTAVDGAEGVYTATVTATERTAFKFKEANDTDWSNQIMVLKDGEWDSNPNKSFGANTEIEIDYSEGSWTLCLPDGIENIVVEKAAVAKKVIVDGQLFIMHEGRLINVLGAQVK